MNNVLFINSKGYIIYVECCINYHGRPQPMVTMAVAMDIKGQRGNKNNLENQKKKILARKPHNFEELEGVINRN